MYPRTRELHIICYARVYVCVCFEIFHKQRLMRPIRIYLLCRRACLRRRLYILNTQRAFAKRELPRSQNIMIYWENHHHHLTHIPHLQHICALLQIKPRGLIQTSVYCNNNNTILGDNHQSKLNREGRFLFNNNWFVTKHIYKIHFWFNVFFPVTKWTLYIYSRMIIMFKVN